MMPKRKVITIVLFVVAVAVIVGLVLWPATETRKTATDVVVFEMASRSFEEGNYAEAEKLCQQAMDSATDDILKERAQRLMRRIQGQATVDSLRQTIFEKEDYSQALLMLQDAMRQYSNDRDLASDLARFRITAVVADFVNRVGTKYSEPISQFEETALRQSRDEISTALERYKENKENGYLEGLKKLEETRLLLAERRENISQRLVNIQGARAAWEDVLSCRGTKAWSEEVRAFETLRKYPSEIAMHFTKGMQVDELLENARLFSDGQLAYGSESFEEARDFLQKIPDYDYHYSQARQLIKDIATNSEYFNSLRLYREGRAAEAVTNLARIRVNDAKFGVLYDLVVNRRDKQSQLEQLQRDRDWEQLLTVAQEFRSTLESPRDGFYIQVAERSIELARQKINESERRDLLNTREGTMAELQTLFDQKQYSRVISGGRELITRARAERFSDLGHQAEELVKRAEKIVLDEAYSWLPQGLEDWNLYLMNPLNEEDRKGAITEEVEKKTMLLSSLYTNSTNALMGARQLPPDKMVEVENINKTVAEEILHQQEILFNIRDTYERLGNVEHMKAAEEKILLFPEVEGSYWHKRVRAQNPKVISILYRRGLKSLSIPDSD